MNKLKKEHYLMAKAPKEINIKNNGGYALQQLELAILLLATEQGNIKDRLSSAYNENMHVIKDEDFPPLLKSEWISLKKLLTKKGPSRSQDGTIIRDALENTLHGMRLATGREIANRLVDLKERLRGYLNDLSQQKKSKPKSRKKSPR